jgi:hypothetical protein
MMATGLVLREVPLLCEDKRSACPARSSPAVRAQAQGRTVGSPAVRGQATRWRDEK